MFRKDIRLILIVSLALTMFILIPFGLPVISYEHDTFFHLSRIEGYANAIKNFDFLPRIYPLKNAGFGYGSPLFYSDIFLFIPSVVYLITDSIVIAYKVLIFILTFMAAFFMGITTRKFSENKLVIILSMTLYTFATYHIANLYVRSAVGELFGYALLPLIILASYRLLYEDDKFYLLTIVISALILSHNLSFLIACILLLMILVLNYFRLSVSVIKQLFFAVFWVILITSFFTMPMLEQLAELDLFVESGNSALFLSSTLKAYQYLMTRTNFYIYNNSFDSMVVNTGLLILFLPLCNVFIIDKDKSDKSRFIFRLMIIGYLFLFLQSGLINYEMIRIFYPLQFVWRFMLISCVCLSIPAAYYSLTLLKKYQLSIFLLLITVSIGITTFLLFPVFSRTNTISHENKYSELIDGSLIDPYYSAWYVRVELAGGDYLHAGGIDFQNYDYLIYDYEGYPISTELVNNYDELIFELNSPNNIIVLPKSYYKGYQVYHGNEKLPTYIDSDTKLVCFETQGTSGEYILKYDLTWIQLLTTVISGISLIVFIYIYKKNSARL